MITTVVALSVSVLVLFVLLFAAVVFLIMAAKEDGCRMERLARVEKDLASANRRIEAMAIENRDLQKAREYNGENVRVFKARSDQLVDCIREMLLALELGSLVGDDPLDTDVAVLVDNLSKVAASRRQLEDCAILMGCAGQPSTVPGRVQELLRKVASQSELQAKYDEKAGKLNHYRLVIDEALGGIHSDGERWSVVHVEAIKQLQAKADAADVAIDRADTTLEVIGAAVGLESALRSAMSSDQLDAWKVSEGGPKLHAILAEIQALKEQAEAKAMINDAIDHSLSPLCEAAGCGPEDLLDAINRLKDSLSDAKRELAEAEEAGSEALEKGGALANQIDAINAMLGVADGGSTFDAVQELQARVLPPNPDDVQSLRARVDELQAYDRKVQAALGVTDGNVLTAIDALKDKASNGAGIGGISFGV